MGTLNHLGGKSLYDFATLIYLFVTQNYQEPLCQISGQSVQYLERDWTTNI